MGHSKKGQVYATDRANKSIFSAICKSRQLNLSLDIQIDLYDKLVAPVALYGCKVWGPFGHDIVSRVQFRYFKYVPKLKKNPQIQPCCLGSSVNYHYVKQLGRVFLIIGLK